MKILFILLFLSGCTVYPKYNFSELGKYEWNNHALSHLSQNEFLIKFNTTKGQCNMESYKVPIPPPSCVQPPKDDCSNKTGIAKGFCQGYTPPMKCDYSSVNEAKRNQTEVFKNCMVANGWQLEYRKLGGTDLSGGTFEKIAYTSSNEYYLKLGTIHRSGHIYSAIIRVINLENSNKSYQGTFYFDSKINKFKIDQDIYRAMPKGSATAILFKRVKQLS